MAVTLDTSRSFPARLIVHQANYAPLTPSDTTTLISSVVTSTRTRTGQRLPHWKKVIQSGGNATTPLTARWDALWSARLVASYKIFAPSNGSLAIREATGDIVFNHLPFGPSHTLGPTASGSVADNRARARFYKKLRQVQVQFSGPTFLGELRETLRMIRRPAQAIRDSVDRYHLSLSKWKGRNRPPASPHKKWLWRQELQKVAGGLWLENSFGWQPLLNDIKDAVAAYERLTPPLANRRVISVGDSDWVDRRNDAGAWGDGLSHNYHGICYFQVLVSAKESITIRYKGSVSVSTEADHWGNAALFGFTPSEFVPTAWELLPWSFLIDYFTNIGDILTASVTKSSNVNFVTKTARSLVTLNGYFLPDVNGTRATLGPANLWTITGGGNVAPWFTQRKSLTRSSGSGVPLPVIQFESGLNIGQMCNITALLTNFMDIHPQSKRNWHR